jgi:hypothetical protein
VTFPMLKPRLTLAQRYYPLQKGHFGYKIGREQDSIALYGENTSHNRNIQHLTIINIHIELKEETLVKSPKNIWCNELLSGIGRQ